MKTELTKKQSEVLKFLTQHLSKLGYPPTMREIAGHFGIKGINAVKKHLDALAKKGHLVRGRQARAIELSNHPQTVSVPILGQVAAGKPILADENILGSFGLDKSVVRGSQCFFLKVKGDSMINAGILDGDHVLVKSQAQAETGEIVVVLVEDEATVKRFFHSGDKIILQPENTALQPMTFTKKDNLRILGKVLGVMRFPNLI